MITIKINKCIECPYVQWDDYSDDVYCSKTWDDVPEGFVGVLDSCPFKGMKSERT